MTLAANILIFIIALLHFYILVLEMFLWETPRGMRVFRHTPETAKITKKLAANQGLYNGFLAAGLLWSLVLGEAGFQVKVFFLVCVIAAGVYGALTAIKKIFYIQALPAIVTLALVLASNF